MRIGKKSKASESRASESKLLHAVEIGTAVDGRLTEALFLAGNDILLLAYSVIVQDKAGEKSLRPVSVVEISYELAKNWYGIHNPGKSLDQVYKPDWMRFMN